MAEVNDHDVTITAYGDLKPENLSQLATACQNLFFEVANAAGTPMKLEIGRWRFQCDRCFTQVDEIPASWLKLDAEDFCDRCSLMFATP